MGRSLRELVVINTESSSNNSYGKITFSGPTCPFLGEGLCSIQNKLGEEYLPKMCAQYPRILNRSLDLSCPEAARLTLLDPDGMRFDGDADELVIWLLKNRSYPLSNRLVILGSMCDQLPQTTEALEAYREGVERDAFGDALNMHRPQPAAQLQLVLELILGRMRSDFTAPRLLACYQKLMQALEWTAESNMEEVGRRYSAAYSQYYAPFMNQHPHILENYLVSYVHRHQLTDFLLMLVHYAIIQTLLIGMAAFHKSEFGTDHVILVIQSFTKAFEHSLSYPERALGILAEKGLTGCASLAILLLN